MYDIFGEYFFLLVIGEVYRKLKNVIISFINFIKLKFEFFFCVENFFILMLELWKNC